MKPVHPDTKRRLLAHLSQAEIELRGAAQFECVQATPAHETVRAALARIGKAVTWLKTNLPVEPMAHEFALTPRERYRVVRRRMAKLAP